MIFALIVGTKGKSIVRMDLVVIMIIVLVGVIKQPSCNMAKVKLSLNITSFYKIALKYE